MSSLFNKSPPSNLSIQWPAAKPSHLWKTPKIRRMRPSSVIAFHGLGQKLHGRNPLRIYSHPEASRNQGLRVKSQWRRLAQEFDTRNRTSYLQGYTILSWWKSPCPVCFFEEISWWSVCAFRVSYTYKNSWHFLLSKQIFSSSSFPGLWKTTAKTSQFHPPV